MRTVAIAEPVFTSSNRLLTQFLYNTCHSMIHRIIVVHRQSSCFSSPSVTECCIFLDVRIAQFPGIINKQYVISQARSLLSPYSYRNANLLEIWKEEINRREPAIYLYMKGRWQDILFNRSGSHRKESTPENSRCIYCNNGTYEKDCICVLCRSSINEMSRELITLTTVHKKM